MALKLISFEITAKKLDDQSQNEDKLDKKRSHREINDWMKCLRSLSNTYVCNYGHKYVKVSNKSIWEKIFYVS